MLLRIQREYVAEYADGYNTKVWQIGEPEPRIDLSAVDLLRGARE